jgi:hypothetical protein
MVPSTKKYPGLQMIGICSMDGKFNGHGNQAKEKHHSQHKSTSPQKSGTLTGKQNNSAVTPYRDIYF